MPSRIASFFYGLSLPFRALSLIARDRGLILLSAVPVAITVALYVYMLRLLQGLARARLLELIAGRGWDPGGTLAWVLLGLTQLLVFLAGALTFSVAASVVASPFNDFLSERAESLATPPLPAVERQALSLKIKLVGVDLLKTVVAGTASLLALLLSWVPVVNALALAAAFLLVTFQYISYPQTRRGEGLRVGFQFLGRHVWSCAGFGASVSFLFAIPFVSALSLPLAVVGGTLLVARARAAPPLR